MRTTPRSMLSALMPALLCLALAGCATPQPPPRQQKDTIPYARVAIVEFANNSPYPDKAEQFTQALREKMVERTDGTDVVVVPRAAVFGDDDPFVSGRISIDALTRVRRDYLADAVIIGALDAIDPYRPPSLHLSLKLVETARGTVPYEVSDGWDAASGQVRSDIEAYYQRNIGKDDCRFGPDMFLISPRYYMRFVADQVVSGLASRLALAR
jgi:hypothetical protein